MAAVVVMTACAPRLYVNVLRPAPVNLGAVKKLAVVQMEGRLDARERVLRELAAQANGAGYFTVADRAGAIAGSDEVTLSMSVLEYGAAVDPGSEKHSQWLGKVVLAVTAADAAGRQLINAKRYKGSIGSDNGEDDALLASTRAAVTALLDDLTPSFVRQAIELDEEDEAQRPIVELARKNALKQAVEQERAMLQRAPTAAAAFNLAALLDAQGQYAEALELYDQALKLGSKELYAQTRGACARRLADTQALGH
jgi:tetratricopeptide (TPR) repeat protein